MVPRKSAWTWRGGRRRARPTMRPALAEGVRALGPRQRAGLRLAPSTTSVRGSTVACERVLVEHVLGAVDARGGCRGSGRRPRAGRRRRGRGAGAGGPTAGPSAPSSCHAERVVGGRRGRAPSDRAGSGRCPVSSRAPSIVPPSHPAGAAGRGGGRRDSAAGRSRRRSSRRRAVAGDEGGHRHVVEQLVQDRRRVAVVAARPRRRRRGSPAGCGRRPARRAPGSGGSASIGGDGAVGVDGSTRSSDLVEHRRRPVGAGAQVAPAGHDPLRLARVAAPLVDVRRAPHRPRQPARDRGDRIPGPVRQRRDQDRHACVTPAARSGGPWPPGRRRPPARRRREDVAPAEGAAVGHDGAVLGDEQPVVDAEGLVEPERVAGDGGVEGDRRVGLGDARRTGGARCR